MEMGRIRAAKDTVSDVGRDAPTSTGLPRPARRPLAAHRSFAPLLGLWGAALAGLSVLVLPLSATAQLAALAGLGAFDHIAHSLIAALAALAGGALAFGIARVVSRIARRGGSSPSVAAMARMRPLRPVEDLGSASFDAPIDRMPLGTKAEDWLVPEAGDGTGTDAREDGPRGDSTSSIRRRLARTIAEVEGTRASEPAPEPAPEPESGPAPEAPEDVAPLALPEPKETPVPPRELDLEGFARLPGRNAVWVEESFPAEPDDEVESEPAPRDPPREARPRAKSAIEMLRETPPQDLSLVAMVERLAAALHERQSAETARGPADVPGEGREAVLAEALKALSVLAEGTGGESHEPLEGQETGTDTADLTAALAKLHDLRGAA